MTKKEKRQAFIMEIKNIIDPLMLKLELIDSKISKGKTLRPAYNRNEDLKKIFGLSNNTIIKYRQTVSARASTYFIS